jgi:phosphoribosyl 1,2-cyclic phosphate phosphodiesterase
MATFRRRFTILGCSSSPGVPRIHGDWGACNPDNPKNRRTRAAFLIEQFGQDGGVTRVVIDTGPDFREQMIAAKVTSLDAVVYTHAHADHLHGIDDVRMYSVVQKQQIPIYADPVTMGRIEEGFSYCLRRPKDSNYPPIVRPVLIETMLERFEISGAGGAIDFIPHWQHHGDGHSLGFRIGDLAYCSDVSAFPDESLSNLKALDLLILDALQYREHPSHLSLKQALRVIEQLQPRHSVLTHMHIPLDYDAVMAETPEHVEPAYDGLSFEFTVEIE